MENKDLKKIKDICVLRGDEGRWGEMRQTDWHIELSTVQKTGKLSCMILYDRRWLKYVHYFFYIFFCLETLPESSLLRLGVWSGTGITIFGMQILYFLLLSLFLLLFSSAFILFLVLYSVSYNVFLLHNICSFTLPCLLEMEFHCTYLIQERSAFICQ